MILRHRSNYARLLRGKENRLWGAKEKKIGEDADRPALDQDATVPSPHDSEPKGEEIGSRP